MYSLKILLTSDCVNDFGIVVFFRVLSSTAFAVMINRAATSGLFINALLNWGEYRSTSFLWLKKTEMHPGCSDRSSSTSSPLIKWHRFPFDTISIKASLYSKQVSSYVTNNPFVSRILLTTLNTMDLFELIWATRGEKRSDCFASSERQFDRTKLHWCSSIASFISSLSGTTSSLRTSSILGMKKDAERSLSE